MMDDSYFSGKNTVVMGFTMGIGLDIAKNICNRGGNVIINSRNLQDCVSVSEKLSKNGKGIAFPISCDISDKDSCSLLIENTVNYFGHIDGIVCNAAYF